MRKNTGILTNFSVLWMYVSVCVYVRRCHRKLSPPWCCHDRSVETLFINDSLSFQPHWIFLFQGEYIFIIVSVHGIFPLSCHQLCKPSRSNVIGCSSCYLNTLTCCFWTEQTDWLGRIIIVNLYEVTHHIGSWPAELAQCDSCLVSKESRNKRDSNLIFPQLETL